MHLLESFLFAAVPVDHEHLTNWEVVTSAYSDLCLSFFWLHLCNQGLFAFASKAVNTSGCPFRRSKIPHSLPKRKWCTYSYIEKANQNEM